MKKYCILLGIVFATVSFAGPTNLKNEKLVAEHKANIEWKASTNYVSDVQYVADLTAATKFDELKAALLKKANSDKFKSDKLKKETGKIKSK